jgi:tetratricopeptide (TPR) repeat protein
MTALIVFAVLSVASLGVLIFFFAKKYSQLRMLSPNSSTDVRDKKKKKEIIRGRLERAGGMYANKAKQLVFNPAWGLVQGTFRTVAGKLTAAERAYKEKRKKQQPSDITPEQLLVWIEEARAFLGENEFDKAEKRLIDVLGLDERCVPAYELLGQVYLKRKDYQLAEETFQFLLKLAPDDASVHAYMGEVLEARGKKEDALTEYKKASDLSPRNPRYLDFLISMAIEVKKTKEAGEALARLREANPENQKISEFEDQIKALS